ncbi:MAG: hypothetical protein ACREA9_17165 [Pyrinomonadaceae bacterium]
MTTAVSEILKQAEQLSPDERLELAARLNGRWEQNAEPKTDNGNLPEAVAAPATAQLSAEAGGSEDDEEDNWLDTLDLKLMPPKRTYMARARFHYVGRGKPLPYDFGDRFDTETETEGDE